MKTALKIHELNLVQSLAGSYFEVELEDGQQLEITVNEIAGNNSHDEILYGPNQLQIVQDHIDENY